MRNMAVVIIIFNGFLYKNTSFRSILEILKVSKGHVTRYIHICTFLSFLLAASMAQSTGVPPWLQTHLHPTDSTHLHHPLTYTAGTHLQHLATNKFESLTPALLF